MEILVVALAALATALIPLMVVMAEVALLGVTALVELGVFLWQWLATGSLDAAREARQTRRESTARLRRWAWWAMAASGGVLVATLVVIVALNFLCFDWFVRQALRTAEKPSGIAVTFADAEGNLFSGRVALEDARFVRKGHPVSDFDLSAAKFDVDADVWQLMTGNFAFEKVSVTGVRGQLTRTGKRDPTLPRRRFTIGQLTVEDVAVEVTDVSRPPHDVAVPLEVASLEITDFRSWWAAFDMLFRSTCQGLIDGQPFTIVTRPTGDGEAQQTQWQARDVPVYLLSGYFAGPLSWLVDGQLDVDVTTRWHPDQSDPELEMHCYLVAHGFAANIPDKLPILQKLAEPALDVLNQSSAQLPIEFNLTMPKDAFQDQLSPLAAGLAEALAQASGTAFTKLLPNVAEKIEDRIDQIRNRLRSRLHKDQVETDENAEE